MIFDRLILHNFGPYRGRHAFELTPRPGQPIVLFVGLNGAGKTTLLTALQVLFYGAQAPAVREQARLGGGSFDDFLLGAINYEDPPAQSASLELEFRATRLGAERRYRLRRSWRRVEDAAPRSEGLAGHRLEVFVDEQADPALAAAWTEAVEEFLPLRLAPLFFFDGEKIEEWSNWRAAEDLIAEAVHALLGLDVLDRALADLAAVERRAQAEVAPAGEDAALAAVRERLEERRRERQIALQQQTAAADARRRAEMLLRELEPQLAARGLPLFDRRAELRALREAAQAKLERAQADERLRRMEAERARRDRERFGELLRERDQALLDFAPPRSRKWLEHWLRQRATLDFQVREAVPAEADSSVVRYYEWEQQLRAEVARLDELLNQVPEAAEGTAMQQKLSAAQRALERAEAWLEETTALLLRHDEVLAPLQTEFERRAQAVLALQRSRTAAARHAEQAHAAATALRQFRARLIEDLCTRLGETLLDRLRRLLHKPDLLDAARIEATERAGRLGFRMLLEKRGQVVDPDRWSAGERQMLALALQWALICVGERPTPIVMDTLLARLDHTSRKAVAGLLGPRLSRQLIILATDQESSTFNGCKQVRIPVASRYEP
ncbi:MAG: AAA family ATPase [Verrucomicrobia bacterium]|nr:AAA family ATPase [Verrucomicrobiota bacterium]